MPNRIFRAFIAPLFLLYTVSLFSQDILKLKKGDELKAVIVSATEQRVEYKSYFFQDGASLFIDKKDLSYIQYSDGRRESFEVVAPPPVINNTSSSSAPSSTGSSLGVSTPELSRSINQLSTQLAASEKNQETQNKAMLELLNSINNNIIALKASIDKKPLPVAYQSTNSEAVAGRSAGSNSSVTNVHKVEAPAAVVPVAAANNATGISEPELENIPYQLKNGEYSFLERLEGSLDNKMKGLYGGNETYISAFGLRSPVRFSASSLPKVYIKFDSKGDPSEKIWLLKAAITKDRRRFLCSSMSMTGAARDASSSRIEVQFKKINDTFYEVIIPYLQSGEYTFTAPMSGTSILSSLTGGGGGRSSKISCFGID